MSSSTTANKKTETLSASEIMDEASKIPSWAVSKPDSNMDASAGQDGSIKPSFPALNPSNLGVCSHSVSIWFVFYHNNAQFTFTGCLG